MHGLHKVVSSHLEKYYGEGRGDNAGKYRFQRCLHTLSFCVQMFLCVCENVRKNKCYAAEWFWPHELHKSIKAGLN